MGLAVAEEIDVSAEAELAEQVRQRTEAKEKIDKLIRHIENVREACTLLGKKLIDGGEIDLGVRLIANGQVHDLSKFSGIEWDYLIQGEFNGEAKLAARHHARTNRAHVEYWGEISNMPKIFLAEFVCDIFARSNEFGECVWSYVKNKAMVRYNISPHGKTYKWIKEFLDLLLEKPFAESPADTQ